MASQLDKSLDEITAERRSHPSSNRPRRGGGQQRQDIRRSAGGVQKTNRDSSNQRHIDSYSTPGVKGSSNDTWTHDLFDRNGGDRSARLAGNPLAARLGETTVRSARLKVENLHYDLSEEDLSSLFGGIGPVEKLQLKYDKLGRSDGVAYVTYTSINDANEAIRKFNGANAAGQPITVTLDAEVTTPRGPASGGFSRPRGPRGFNRGPPRHGGGRMDGGGGRGRGGPRGAPGERRDRQPRRTQEDLDKELEDFMSAPPPAENGNGEGNGEEMALD